MAEQVWVALCRRYLATAGQPDAWLSSWQWHLDEMYVKLNGEMVYLWRTVDHKGEILESYISKTRDKAASRERFALD
ncbi:DDE-type integrase/transposase/recombinase [uncultured Sphingomonas sp.]|uniref:DDE-type integrase/transposase/recombinase n=1 Tax=uncultured Sphingomonas sp. TaxID=158754 RepID=UPI0025E6DC0D|nr:DDE-type integrase/transposase/recombinase [uncultured Sphingomonas sp.]